MDLKNIIIAPIITEKSTKDVTFGKFTFHVAKKANKRIIKEAVEDRFKVNVLDTATVIVKGKRVRVGKRRVEVVKNAWKKAVVTLKKGQKIDLFETGGSKANV